MASNGEIESEDNEITESNGDKVVTMMDVLQEQEDFEEDANAVLGASDDKNCTYPLGYIKRQAIYACMTCCSDAKEDPSKRAGVCLACSLTCHENHELIELYTKRNFRCDCGNPKFNSHPCQFTPEKIDLNEENSYNQNFSGLYCVCHRPYPDPEATEEDEMIQCIICEDWLHASHLEATVPSAQYAEMICKECMQKNEFLHDYSDLAVNTENDFIDIITTIDDKIGLCNGVSKNEIMDTTISEVDQNNIDAEMPQVNESKNESDLVQNSKEIANQNEKEEDNDKTHMESEVPMDTEQLNDENLSTVTKDPEMAQVEVSADKIVSLSESDSVKIQEDITETAENKEHNEENIESHINALKEIVEASEESVADIIISEIDNAKVVENVENNDKIQHMEAEVPMDTNTEKPNDENMSPDAKDSEKAQGEITASPETEDSASVSNPVKLQENIIDNVETKESNEENFDIKINTLKDIVEDSEESVADNITSEIDKPKEDENKDYNINKTQHNIESEVPMDTNTDKVIMPTHAKDSEVAQEEVIESSVMDKSVSVSNPEKSHNITDTAKNKDSYEDSIDSLKEIVESSEDNVADNIISEKEQSKNKDSIDTLKEILESSEDNVADNIISEKEQSKNKDSIDTLKELVKSSEDNVANNITSEQEQSKEEEIKETTVSPIAVIANTNEPKVDEVLPSTNDISEAENKNEKSLLSDDSNKLENNEHINDPKTEKRNEKQLADDGKNMLTEDNINQNSESVVDNDTHYPSNDANGKTVEPAENNQNIEKQNDKTGIHTASISGDNIIKKTDVSNSAEELEKMEEDRLLADPDENAQKEEATENKNSVESINKESTGKSSEPLKKDNIIEEPKSSISEPKDQDNENPDKTDILDENNTETAVQSEDMKTKKDIDGSCTENSINSTTIHNETKMEVNIEETQYSSDKVPMEGTSDKHDTKRKLSVEESVDSEAKKRKVDSIQCVRPKEGKRKYKGATFWPSHFRQKLCTCNECLTMYKDLSILFLMDLEDTVAAYENLGKEKTNGKPASQYEKGLQALSSLDRIQQINVLTEYNNMRDKFLDFLKSFKDRRKIVTEEDVKAFFAGMKPKRRPDGVYFCR